MTPVIDRDLAGNGLRRVVLTVALLNLTYGMIEFAVALRIGYRVAFRR